MSHDQSKTNPYRKVSVATWTDRKVMNLSPLQPSGQALFLMLMVGPQTTNIPGIQPVGRMAFAEMLGYHVSAREHVMTALQIVHWLAGLVVLAEALNKLERTAPCRQGLGLRERITEGLRALAWGLLALGGAGAFVSPLMPHLLLNERAGAYLAQLMPLQKPMLQDVCIVLGFAVLIVRTRVKEG